MTLENLHRRFALLDTADARIRNNSSRTNLKLMEKTLRELHSYTQLGEHFGAKRASQIDQIIRNSLLDIKTIIGGQEREQVAGDAAARDCEYVELIKDNLPENKPDGAGMGNIISTVKIIK